MFGVASSNKSAGCCLVWLSGHTINNITTPEKDGICLEIINFQLIFGLNIKISIFAA